MEDQYVNEEGQKLLEKLKREGVLPSPYNFANYKAPSLDEYIVHDSTLREGEQTPGVIFSIEDKLKIAKKLDDVGIPQVPLKEFDFTEADIEHTVKYFLNDISGENNPRDMEEEQIKALLRACI